MARNNQAARSAAASGISGSGIAAKRHKHQAAAP